MIISNILSNHSNVVQSVYVTGSITPAANALILVDVFSNTSNQSTPTVTGAGMTWVQVADINTTNTRATRFRGMSSSPSSGALTITFSNNQSNVYWSVNQFIGADQSGTNGSGAMVQSVTGTLDGSIFTTCKTITLASLASNQNVTLGGIVNNGSNTISAGVGFTELSNINDAQTAEVEWGKSNSVNWTWNNSQSQVSAIASEIKALVAGGSFLTNFL